MAEAVEQREYHKATGRRIAMTDGRTNQAIVASEVPYMESMGWKRIVPLEDEAPDASPEPEKAPPAASEADPGTDAAQALAKAVEAAATPARRR